MTVGLVICAVITVLTTVGIILVLGVQSYRVLRACACQSARVPVRDRAQARRYARPSLESSRCLWGTFLVAAGSSMIALPIGLLSAIYLSEYAPARVRAVLKPTLELLAGIPTIVYGYVALLLVTPILKRLLEPLGLRVETFNALAGVHRGRRDDHPAGIVAQ